MATTTTEPYRDATFSRRTRDKLERAAIGLRLGRRSDRFELADALDDVVRRWDANDATEIELDPAEADEPDLADNAETLV